MNWLMMLLQETKSVAEQHRAADRIAVALVREARSELAAAGVAHPSTETVNRRAEALYLAHIAQFHHTALQEVEMHRAIARQSAQQRG